MIPAQQACNKDQLVTIIVFHCVIIIFLMSQKSVVLAHQHFSHTQRCDTIKLPQTTVCRKSVKSTLCCHILENRALNLHRGNRRCWFIVPTHRKLRAATRPAESSTYQCQSLVCIERNLLSHCDKAQYFPSRFLYKQLEAEVV